MADSCEPQPSNADVLKAILDGFNHMNERFDQLDRRFDQLDRHMNERFDQHQKQGERELAAIEQFIAEKEKSVESREHLRVSSLSCIDTLDDLYSFSSRDLSSSSVEASSDPFVW